MVRLLVLTGQLIGSRVSASSFSNDLWLNPRISLKIEGGSALEEIRPVDRGSLLQVHSYAGALAIVGCASAKPCR